MEQDPASQDGLSRRRFLRHAVAAAWASPFIVTLASHSAQAAGPGTCGKKIGGAGTTECRVTTPCGSAAVGCKGSPAAPAGSPCYCL